MNCNKTVNTEITLESNAIPSLMQMIQGSMHIRNLSKLPFGKALYIIMLTLKMRFVFILVSYA